mmetsp:Transcript_69/g.116  ORF Transcript_69/g.116 Transcript_69/m.116 type:complete len:362 (-) Transcript_69:109-1194(-)
MGGLCSRNSRRGQQRRCRLPRAHGNEPVFSVVNVGGTQVATAGGDRSVCLWDCLSGAVLQKWNEAHGKEVARLAHVASTSDNTTLASGGRDGGVKIWTAGQPEAVAQMEGHRMAVSGLAAIPTQPWLLSGSRDYSVRLWDLHTSKQIGQRSISRNVVTFMRPFPNEATVAQTSEDLHVYIWDARTVKPAQTFGDMAHIPHCVDCSADGTQLVTSHNGFSDEDGCEVIVWDRRQGKALRRFVGHTQSANACVFLPHPVEGGSPQVVSASKDGTLRLWDTPTGRCLAAEHHSGQCTAMDAIGRGTGGGGGNHVPQRIPGQRASFSRMLCTADLKGGLSLWGIRSSRKAADDDSNVQLCLLGSN